MFGAQGEGWLDIGLPPSNRPVPLSDDEVLHEVLNSQQEARGDQGRGSVTGHHRREGGNRQQRAHDGPENAEATTYHRPPRGKRWDRNEARFSDSPDLRPSPSSA